MPQELEEKVSAPSDPEPKEVLSEAEVRFERWRKRVGLVAGPLAALIIFMIPTSLSPEGHRLAALLTGVVIFWITEPIPIPITALLGPILAIILGLGKADEVLSSFGHPILFIFLGSFLIARAMEGHHLDRRFSLWLLSFRWVGDSPGRILWMLGAITAFLSMWISNTAATAMMFPIALGILASLRPLSEKGALQSYSIGVMLMIAYAASIGGIGTPIGTPPNLIGIGMIAKQAGREITFFEWMLLALPLLTLMYVLLYFLLRALHPAGPLREEGGVSKFIHAQRERLGPWTPGQKNTLIAFLVAVFLWILPGLLALVYGAQGEPVKRFNSRMPEGAAAIVAASLLFFLPTHWSKQEFTLSWREAVKIDWGTILLFGGGLALGDLMFKTGLSKGVGEGLLSILAIDSLWGITGLAIALGIVVSELTSNTAAANMIIPAMIGLATASGVSPIPPALGATLGASYGFMLPVSTPPNAIVYGSGLIPISRMIRAGLLFDFLGFFVIWGGLRLLCPLLGLM